MYIIANITKIRKSSSIQHGSRFCQKVLLDKFGCRNRLDRNNLKFRWRRLILGHYYRVVVGVMRRLKSRDESIYQELWTGHQDDWR